MNLNRIFVNEESCKMYEECNLCYFLFSSVKCPHENTCNFRLHDTGRVTVELKNPVYRFVFSRKGDIFVGLSAISSYYLNWFSKNKFKYFISLRELDICIHHYFQNTFDNLRLKGLFEKDHSTKLHEKNNCGSNITTDANIIFTFKRLICKNLVNEKIVSDNKAAENLFFNLFKKIEIKKLKNLKKYLQQIK